MRTPQDHTIVMGVGPESGLGATLCRRFAAAGHHVWVVGRSREKLDYIVANIAAAGGEATAHIADATDEAQVIALFDAVERAGGDYRVRSITWAITRPDAFMTWRPSTLRKAGVLPVLVAFCSRARLSGGC